jgi:hypothetical protein
MLERFKGESFVAMMQTVIVQLALQIVIQKKLPLKLGLGLLVPNEVVPTPMSRRSSNSCIRQTVLSFSQQALIRADNAEAVPIDDLYEAVGVYGLLDIGRDSLER